MVRWGIRHHSGAMSAFLSFILFLRVVVVKFGAVVIVVVVSRVVVVVIFGGLW